MRNGEREADRSDIGVLDIAEAAAEATGAFGLPGASLLGWALGRARTDRRARQQDFMLTLDRAMETLKDKVDTDFIQSEEFAATVEEIVEKGARRRELTKRQYYAAACANSATLTRPPEAERYRMIDTLERLRQPHLAMLAALLNTPRWEAPYGPMVDMSVDNGTLTGLMPEQPFDVLVRDWHDLRRAGLVTSEPEFGPAARSGYRSFATDFGVMFSQFITLPISDVHPIQSRDTSPGVPE